MSGGGLDDIMGVNPLWDYRLDPTGQGSYKSMQEDREAQQRLIDERGVADPGVNPELDPSEIEARNRKIRENLKYSQTGGYASTILTKGSGVNTDYGKSSSSMLT